MVISQRKGPFGLVVTGEAGTWQPALEQIIGSNWVRTIPAVGDVELIRLVQSGEADAAVLDEEAHWDTGVLQILRMIRRVNAELPVVVLTRRSDRRMLEDALRLAAFSVVAKPLELEELLRQLRRMMLRLEAALRDIDMR
jgi:DNA-binding NtrC family response regulator